MEGFGAQGFGVTYALCTLLDDEEAHAADG